jgi:hypothetical protein
MHAVSATIVRPTCGATVAVRGRAALRRRARLVEPFRAVERLMGMWRSLAIGLVVAGLLAGCGGTGSADSSEQATTGDGPRLSKRQYERSVAEIIESKPVREADRLFFKLAAGDVTADECTTETRRFLSDVGSGIDAVAKLNAPVGVDGLQARIVVAGRQTEKQLQRLAEDVAAGKVSCGQEWNSRAYGLRSTDRAVAILAEYARRGYLIATNGE